MVLDAGVDEFLLEGAVELQPGDVLQGRKGAAQEVARAAFPRYAGGGSDVAGEAAVRTGVNADQRFAGPTMSPAMPL